MKLNQPNFFSGLIGQLKEEEVNLHQLNEIKKLPDESQKMIKEGFKKVEATQAFLDQVKIYILIKGTVSAGKSTFLNSLLGQELLPSKAQECTSKPLLIKNGPKLKINGKEFQNLNEATKTITMLMKDQTESIEIETYSIFHRDLEKDLSDRVILVDLPGFITGQATLNDLLDIPKCIEPGNQIIQLIVSDYGAFAEQKNKIFNSIKTTQKMQTKPKPQVHLQYLSKDNPKQFLFVINKFDLRKNEDDPSEQITQEIQNTIGEEAEIFKISSQNALRYRIMKFSDVPIQNDFIETFFMDYKDTFQFDDFQECQYFCKKFIKTTTMIQNTYQEYTQLLSKLNSEIQCKIKGQFEEHLCELRSNIYLMQMTSNSTLRISKPSQEDKVLHQKNWTLLENQKTKINKETIKILQEIEQFIENESNQFKVWEQIKSKQNKTTVQILSEICCEISLKLNQYHQLVSIECQCQKDMILENLSQLQISDFEKQALISAVSNLFTKYLEVQNVQISKKTKNLFEQCYKDTLGVLVITKPVTEVSLLTGGLGALNYYLGLTYEASATAATTAATTAANSTRLLTWCTGGIVGGATVGVISTTILIFQVGKFVHQLYKNDTAFKNLDALKGQLKVQTNNMSEQFIQIIKNFQGCLQCLSKSLE